MDLNSNILKSCRSSVISFVKFTNCTSQRVRLEWVNFTGGRVCYCKELKPGDHFSVKTYVGHPWVACESKYKHPLCFDTERETIYFPVASDFSADMPSQAKVDIFTPHKRLSTTCLHVIHRHLSQRGAINQLEISRNFVMQLESLFDAQENRNTPIVMRRAS